MFAWRCIRNRRRGVRGFSDGRTQTVTHPFLVQDNEWDISASADEIRAQDAYEFIQGFKGIEAYSIEGNDFIESYDCLEKVLKTIRKERRPFLVHAKVPLLNHHTSGVRMEWYRDDLAAHQARDPYPILVQQMLDNGFSQKI